MLAALAPFVPSFAAEILTLFRFAPISSGSNYIRPGNQLYLKLVKDLLPDYRRVPKADRPRIAMQVVRAVRHEGGRFVDRVKAGSGSLMDVGDQAACQKVMQSFRDMKSSYASRVGDKRPVASVEVLQLRENDYLLGSGGKKASEKLREIFLVRLPLSFSRQDTTRSPPTFDFATRLKGRSLYTLLVTAMKRLP
jgi:hypothetical protein